VNEILTKLAEIFLLPISILATALGAANNERLKAGLSVAGLAVSVLWFACTATTIPEQSTLTNGVLRWGVPVVCIIAWGISTRVHIDRWRKEGL
jgi:hypothetical protein